MRKSISVTLIIVAVLVSITTSAQHTTVHLKNGSSVRGELVEFIHGEKLSVKIFDNHVAEFPWDDIQRYKIRSKNGSFDLPDLGYFNYTSIGLIWLKDNEWSGVYPHISAQTTNGWRFEKFTSAGLGVGLDRYGEVSALPIFLSVRRDLFAGRATPSVYGNIGHSIMWESDSWDFWEEYTTVDGGLYWELGGGIRINYSKAALLLNLGFKKQQVDLVSGDEFWSRDESRKFRNINFTVGVEF